jgi:hypothetical protein
MVRNDLKFTVWKIEELNMDRETVRITLSSSLDLKNVCDKIISQNLIGKQKIRKKDICVGLSVWQNKTPKVQMWKSN